MPRLTDFTTLTFDCYGTLIDWERGILDELRPWLARHGRGDLDDGSVLEAFAEAEMACEAEVPARLYPAVLAEVHQRLARHWGLPPDAAAAAEFGWSVGRWPAFADSVPSLQYLKRYYKLVIVSNVDRASFAKSNARLGVAFDLVVTAEDVGSYKPDVRNFEHALIAITQTLGAAKSNVLHTAQSLFHDIVPAKALGLRTMWINRRKGSGGWGATPAPATGGDAAVPDFEVASLADMVALHQAHLAQPDGGRSPTAKGGGSL
jgi:2-haloalkanoic acid dehalogenase type II